MKTNTKFFLLSIIMLGFVTINMVNAQNLALAIVSDKMNELYFGIGNPIFIADSGFVSDKINTTINNDTLRRNNGKYVIKIKKPTINNGTLIGNNGKFIIKIEKNVNTTFEVPVDGKKVDNSNKEFNVKIPKSELEKIGNVFFGFEDFPNHSLDLNFKFEVYSFNLSRKSTQGDFINDTKYYNISGAEKAMKVIFKECKPSEKIYITDIEVSTPDGLRRLPSINITVK